MQLRPPGNRGLTLIEVLVALSIMAVLALLSWRVIDGMTKTQTIARDHSDHWLNWQTTLAQWQTDLDAMADAGTLGPLDFDGRVLRLTRRDMADEAKPEMRVVAWTVQVAPSGTAPHLMRWVSRPVHDPTQLQNAWGAAQAWGQSATTVGNGQAMALVPVQAWSLFYHRGGSWTNPLSDAGPDNTPNSPRRGAPDGIRLTLTLPETGLSTGTLSKDWVNPTVGGDKTQ